MQTFQHSGDIRHCGNAVLCVTVPSLIWWHTVESTEYAMMITITFSLWLYSCEAHLRHQNARRHKKNAYRLQKIPVDCPCEWDRADRSWKNTYTFCLPFFFPSCAWKYIRKRSQVELKHDSTEFLSSPTGKITVLKRKKGSWLSSEVLIFSVTYTDGNSYACIRRRFLSKGCRL